MLQGAEDNVPASTTSNPWSLLGLACRRSVAASGTKDALDSILRLALDATTAERAFLVTSPAGDPDKHRIEASASVRADGVDSVSRNVLKWAFSKTAPRVGIDLHLSGEIQDDASVRALGLRLALSASVPSRSRDRTSLLLDGRSVSSVAAPELCDLLSAFAGLAGLVMGSTASSQAGWMPRPAPGPRDGLVGRSPAFIELLERVRKVASWRLPVLVVGESGSGKEGIARALHREGARRDGPYLAVNCSAIPETLLESELFGAVRGAYTGSDQDRPGLFRLAHGGTLFLDEVGDMPASMQAKLLRVLQEGTVRPVGGRADSAVDVRVVAATHRDLLRLVREGRFREDLYWRLAMVDLRVPPLRSRPEDIPLLVDHVAKRLAAATHTGPIRVGGCAMQKLLAHLWPGNVRELEAVLARALLRSDGGEILAGHLDLGRGDASECPESPSQPPALERAMIEAALHHAAGNITRAARRIGWSRPKLYRRMSALGVIAIRSPG